MDRLVHLDFEDDARRFQVRLESAALTLMFGECLRAGRQETGGILIGRYMNDGIQAIVGEATAPPSGSKFGRAWFQRSEEGLARLLKQRWSQEPRTHYVGEWHFHPAWAPWPSPQDAGQMASIARDRSYRCEKPLLMIVCRTDTGGWVVRTFLHLPEDCRLHALQVVDSLSEE